MTRFRSFVAAGLAAWTVSVAAAQAPPPAPAAPAPAAPGPAPKIRFEAKEIDLGNVVRGQDAIAEFVYKNEGDAPLKIVSARPG